MTWSMFTGSLLLFKIIFGIISFPTPLQPFTSRRAIRKHDNSMPAEELAPTLRAGALRTSETGHVDKWPE
jgi:hypothetical protein